MWWKIWYVDFEIIGKSIQEWIDAPDEGILGIYEFFGFDEDGIPLGRISSGSDWYWMTESGDIYQNNDSTYERDFWIDVEIPIGAYAKKGKWTSEEKMDQVSLEMVEISKVGIYG